MRYRKPSREELQLLEFMLNKAHIKVLYKPWKNRVLVVPMQDGGMGSLRWCLTGVPYEQSPPLHFAVDHEFLDTDKVPVLVTLYIDNRQQVFELDVWKADFSPLVAFSSLTYTQTS